MSSSRPIITLQIGNYSNYIGTHYFNSQMNYFSSDPETDRSVFWTEGMSQERKVVWTPRLLLFDLQSNWPRRTRIPSQGELERAEMGWDGDVNRVFDEKNENVKPKPPGSIGESWGDYLEWKLESMEKVSFPISSFTYNSSLGVLSNYEQGTEIYSNLQERIIDGIRRYAENCDYLQGFHLLIDQDDGFGGIGNGILSHISDEYEKTSRLAIATSPATNPRLSSETRFDAKMRMMNTTLTWNSFNNHSSIFTTLSLSQDISRPFPQPKSFPLLNYAGNSHYESSAILAAVLDTLTTPYLTQSNSESFNLLNLVGLLGAYGRKMMTLGASFPLDVGEKTLFGTLRENGPRILQSLTPGLTSPCDFEKSIGNYFVIRGVPNEKVMRQSEEIPGLRLTSSRTCLEFFSREFCPKSVNVIRSVSSPFKMSHPFPPGVVESTFLRTQPKTLFRGKDSWSVGVIGSGHNSPAPGQLLDRIIGEVDIRKVSDCFPHRPLLEVDDYVECLEALRILRESYLTQT